jgi:HSP20 family molecular chaperone IbpA
MAKDEVRFRHILFDCSDIVSKHAWQPRADVYRVAGGWSVKLELAGVDPDDIVLTACGNFLRIQGTRRDARLQGCMDCHRLEIEYSRFERLLEIPGLSESAKMGVSYHDGMLLIRIQTEELR